MKSCPCCGSGKIKEYRVNGIWALSCSTCGFDSAAKEKTYHDHQREREREERGKEKAR